MFANIPVLSTNQKDVTRLTEEYKLGGITQHATPHELAKTIEDVLEQYPNGLSSSNRQRFISEYCWENQSMKLLELYAQL